MTQFLHTLSETRENYVDIIQNDRGIKFGLDHVDKLTRGIRHGELWVVYGYTHHGKTFLALRFIYNNPDVPIMFVCPDESKESIYGKLLCLENEIRGDEAEYRIKTKDPAIYSLMKNLEEKYSNLFITSLAMNYDQLTASYHALEGEEKAPKIIIYDYLRMFPEGNDMNQKAELLKEFGQQYHCGMMVLQQCSRGAMDRYEHMPLAAMEYGGESPATVCIGVRRRALNTGEHKMSETLAAIEMQDPSVTLYVAKNKRLGGGLSPNYGMVHSMHRISGLITDRDTSQEDQVARVERFFNS